jgi:hypothetical protein
MPQSTQSGLLQVPQAEAEAEETVVEEVLEAEALLEIVKA